MNQEIKELKSDYVCDENYTHIDAYFSDDENAEGKTIAVVCNDTNKVIFFDNGYRGTKQVTDLIEDVKNNNNLYTRLQYAKKVLSDNGYYTDNLWQVSDVKEKFDCTDDEAMDVLDGALQNDATMAQIWYAIGFHGEDDGLVKIDRDEN